MCSRVVCLDCGTSKVWSGCGVFCRLCRCLKGNRYEYHIRVLFVCLLPLLRGMSMWMVFMECAGELS